MKFCITGAAGNISKPLVQLLLQAGHHVKVIGRNAGHLQPLKTSGAELAIGSLEDPEFLKHAFHGADAVYTMCPPVVTNEAGITDFCERVGRHYVYAIEQNHIRWVVNLSSVGAHLAEGAGHITGMNRVEQILNQLQDVHIKHLRPTFFYTNLLAQIELIRNFGLMGANFQMAPGTFPLAAPSDIAAVAAEELMTLDFSGHSFRYISSDERGTDDIAFVIGEATGKPGLKWIRFPDEQVYQSMIAAGFSQATAKEFVEGFNSMENGKLLADYWKHRPQPGQTKLETFAKTFAAVYAAESQKMKESQRA